MHIAPGALSATPTTVGAGGALAVSDTVTASGRSVGGFWVKFYLSADAKITSGDVYLGGRWVPGLAAGASSSAVTTVTVPAGLSGTFRLGAIVETDGETHEAKHGRRGGVITVVQPDLQVASVSASPAKVPAGDSVSVTSSVTCTGAAAGGFWVRYYLSADATITTGDVSLGGRWVSGLAAGATSADTQAFPVPAGLTGTYHVGAIADADGGVPESSEANNALAGALVEVGVDVVPPVITLTGISNGAFVNQDVTVCYTVTDDHLASVQASLGATPFGAGAASACATASGDGVHPVSVTASDAAGNTDTKTLSFTIDRTLPEVAVVSPADGSITSAGAVEVVVTASDDRQLALVQVNGAAATLGSEGRWRAAIGLGGGPQVIEAYARDAAGNARSSTVTVTRDSDPPVITLSSPAEGSTLTSETVTVAGRVDDATAVQLTVAGEAVAVGPDGSFSTTIHRTSGEQTIVVSATDAAGNADSVTRHVTIAAQPPSLVVSEPQAGFVATHTPIAVRGTAKSAGGGAVTVTLDGMSVPVGADGSFSGSVEPSAGAVTLELVATDSAGGTTQVSVAGSYHPSGGDAPSDGAITLVISSPPDQAVTGLGSVPFEGRVEGGTPPYQVTVAGVPAVVNGGAFSAALPLVEGDHAIQLRATDAAGHGATSTRNVSVDHTAPYLAITRPSAPSADVAESPYLIEGTVGDAHLASVTVQGEAATVMGGQFARAVPLLAGDNTVTVIATDVAGNVTTRSVALHVASLPPTVTIIEPLDGAEAPGAIVHVRVSVDATSALQSVTIGTGPAQLQNGEWVADFGLALGDNTIVVRAMDAAGMTGSASVRVRYRDANQEPLAVIGVEPAPGATGADPTSLVTVSFNKPVLRDSVAGAFTVSANGSPLVGGYYVAPGEQLASFIAKQPLQPGQRLEVKVAGVQPKAGPGMEKDFASDFTVQAARRHLMGNVVDPQFQPVDGVRVEVEGTGLSTRSAPDGSWVITEPPAGTATVRFEGGKLPDGGSMPTVRRQLFVMSSGDTKDRLLVLTPIDGLATTRVDGRSDTRASFALRYPGLALDLAADGVFFQDGQTQGFVTATELQPWANPVPVESKMVVGGLWQVQPAGISVTKPVGLSMPNLPGLPPGRYAVALTYDPSRHMLRRSGLVRVSDDGSALQTVEPVVAGGLDLFGFALLTDEQHQVVLDVLAGKNPPARTDVVPSGSGASLSRSSKVKLALFELFLLAFGGEAHAQLGVGGPFGIGGFGIGWGGIDSYMRGPGVHWVSGRVRSPQDMQVDVQVIRGELTVAEQTVALPYAHDVEFWVLSDDYDGGGHSPLTARLRVNRASLTRNSSDPSSPTYLSREELAPPADQATQWGTVDRPRTGQGKITITGQVPLELGTTLITVEGMQARSTGSTATRTRRLVAELTALPNAAGPDGTVDQTPKKARLTIKRSDEPTDRAFSYDAGGYHYDSGGTSYFRNWTVTADGASKSSAVTDPTGLFSMGVFSYGGYSRGIVCTEVDAGLRWMPYVDPSSDKDHPRIAYDWYRTGYPICTNTWMPPGGSSRVQLVVDARLLLGDVTFFNRDERRVACDTDSATAWDPETSELTAISANDVAMTEVYFFREDDLREPIAKYAVAAPDVDKATGKLVCGEGRHAKYARLRLGPADRTTRRIREQCDYYRSRNETDNPWYKVECATKTRVNGLRLSAGDRLVVVGVNHATGYAGMATVTVPPIQRVTGSPDGSCPADAASGPIEFYEYGQKYTISRCADQDIRVPANLRLYPPEVDLRVARQVKDQGAVEGGQPMRTHLVRHGGAATTRDEFIQISSHWRVRLPPATPVPTDPQYTTWLAQHEGIVPLPPQDRSAVQPGGTTPSTAPGAILDVSDRDGDGVQDVQDRCPELVGVASAQGCPAWMDTDHDGTLDSEDQCPVSPGPADSLVGAGCPDPARPSWQPPSTLPIDDADLDGVRDAEDRCPLHQGPAGNAGCPVLALGFDIDEDGVPDTDDECIMMPGPVAKNGCPDPAQPGWSPPARPPRKPGDPGRLLEKYCAELQAPTPDQLKICRKLEERLTDMPAGVPPLAAHLVKIPGAAAVPGADKPFPILPGAHTNNVQAAFRVLPGAGGTGAVDVQNLENANYYVHVVGNMVLINDQNGDWAIDSKQEIAVAPPAFVQPANPPAGWSDGVPERAIPVKAVYRSWEPDAMLVERYDRAREHEFRIMDVAKNSVTAEQADATRRVDQPTGGKQPSASPQDLSYQMLLALVAPQAPGRAGTMSGEYVMRLGSDQYGVECQLTVDAVNAAMTGDCGGEYLYDVLAASDILYMELYLSGNAENVLYRFNFNGLARRKDYLAVGSEFTAEKARTADKNGTPDVRRPISAPARAMAFVNPADLRSGTLKFCTDEQCASDASVLKSALLELKSDGTYKVTDKGGTVQAALVQVPEAGVGGAVRFDLPLPPELASVPGAEGTASTVYAVIESLRGRVSLALGKPQAEFQGTHVHAAGQPDVAGVNLADGHLALDEEDLSLPELGHRVSFTRYYDNQWNEQTPLGIGWTHSFDGFVVQEAVGRYAVVLAGQAYAFTKCKTLDRSASECETDRSHGGRLTVGKKDGKWDVAFETVEGVRYKFDELSAQSYRVHPLTRAKVEDESRMRWRLTAFEDGHASADGSTSGWTKLTYRTTQPGETFDLLDKVERTPGKVTVTLGYKAVDLDDPLVTRELKSLARRGFQFLDRVTLKAGTTISHTVTFKHDVSGNLSEVTRPGAPQAIWRYGYYAPGDLPGTPESPVTDPARAGALRNELRTAELFVAQDGVELRQWASEYRRSCTSKSYAHVNRCEVVDSVVLPGKGGAPIQIAYDAARRTVSEPGATSDGSAASVVTTYDLNKYGNANVITVGSSVTKLAWESDDATPDGKVVLKSQTSPTGREIAFEHDGRLRETLVRLVAAGQDSMAAAGVAPGTVLRDVAPEGSDASFDARYGVPLAVLYPAADGTKYTEATELWPTGDVKSRKITDAAGRTVSLRQFTSYQDDVLRTEVDEAGRTITYADADPDGSGSPNPFGLPEYATVTLPADVSSPEGAVAAAHRIMKYDDRGRLTSTAIPESGSLETRSFDALGRALLHYVAGTPPSSRSWKYVAGADRVEIREFSGSDTTPRRTRTYVQGLPETEGIAYGSPEQVATKAYTHLGGKLVRLADERGVIHRYFYDTAGRLTRATAQGAATADETEELSLVLDAEGKPSSAKDHNGLETRMKYDVLGRAAFFDRSIAGDKDEEELTLDLGGAAAKRTVRGLSGEHVYSYALDALGRIEKTTSSDGSVNEERTYSGGRLATIVDRVTELEQGFEYADALGRVTRHWRKVQAAEATGTAEVYDTETRTYVLEGGAVKVTAQHGADWKDVTGGNAGTNTWNTEWKEDGQGRVLERTSWVHGARATKRYEYDPASGQLWKQWEPGAANPRMWDRDRSGYVVAYTDPVTLAPNKTITYTTDGGGLVTSQVGPLPGETWTTTYDAFGQVAAREVAAWGNTPAGKWTYDRSSHDGKVVEKDPLQYTSERTSNAAYRVVKELRRDDGGTRRSGNTLETTYEFLGDKLSSKVVKEGKASTKWTFFVDARGRETFRGEEWTSGSGATYAYAKSTSWTGRAATVEIFDGPSSDLDPYPTLSMALVHDSVGSVLSSTQGGFASTWTYDASGRLAVKRPSGLPSTTYAYEEGLLVREQFATVPEEVTSYTYWPDGKVHTIAEPSGRAKMYDYDARGDVKLERYGTFTQETRTAYEYDEAGNLRVVRKGSETGPGWAYTHGPRGELQKVVQPGDAGTFTYVYDAGARLRFIRPDGYDKPGESGAPEQEFEHDYLSRESIRRVATSQWTTEWTGGESRTLEPDQGVVRRLYDGRGRLAKTTFEPASGTSTFGVHDVMYTYTAQDQPSRITELAVFGRRVVHQYDARGLLKQLDRGPGQTLVLTDTLKYEYEPSGRVKSVTPAKWFGFGSGTPVTYGYYPDGRLKTVSDGSRAVTYSWEPGGERVASIEDSSVREERCYDGAGRLSAMIAVPTGSGQSFCGLPPPENAFAALQYQYDARGNRTSEKRAQRFPGTTAVTNDQSEYGYDAADRLIGVKYDQDRTAELYKLGADGTRLGEKHYSDYTGSLAAGEFDATQVPGTLTRNSKYEFYASGQLMYEFQDRGQWETARAWSWDDAGRLIWSRSYASGGALTSSTDYAWDAVGRVREVTTAAGVASYTYEPEGYRRIRNFRGEETTYLHQRGTQYAEQPPSGTPLVYASVGPEAAYAGGDRIVRDALGSPVARIEGSTVRNLWRYDAWGQYRPGGEFKEFEAAPAGGESLAYTGHAWDGAPQLIFAQQRWYDPSIGRFISRDPAEARLGFPATTNPYLYAAANPTAFVDPNGAEPVTMVVLAVAASIAVGMAVDGGLACVSDAVESGVFDGCGQAARSAALPSFAAGATTQVAEWGLKRIPVIGNAFSATSKLRRLVARAGMSAALGAAGGAAYAWTTGGDPGEAALYGMVWGVGGGLAMDGALALGGRVFGARGIAGAVLREGEQAATHAPHKGSAEAARELSFASPQSSLPASTSTAFAPPSRAATADLLARLPDSRAVAPNVRGEPLYHGSVFTTGADSGLAFDPAKLSRIQASLERQGVSFVTGDEGARMARALGGEAVYLPTAGEPGIIAWGPAPSRSAVVEELMHLGQHRAAGWADVSDRIVELELAAQDRLLQTGARLGWSDAELARIAAARARWAAGGL